MTKLRLLLDELRSNFWLLPAVMVAAGVALAFLLVEVDTLYPGNLSSQWPRLFGAGAAGSRGLLSAIASSMITVAGVIFSITVVSLSLASSQYSPRILRNFVRDRSNQAVLGVFLGVFAYCLVVLRTIRVEQEQAGGFVPDLAVFGAVLLAFVAIGFLIFFIHHIAISIQATHIIMTAAKETLASVDRMFPSELGEESEEACEETMPECPATWAPVLARKTGYVQGVEGEDLLQMAKRHDLVIRMERSIGDFVAKGTPIASVAAERCTDVVGRAVSGAFAIGQDRTVEQDPAFGIRQIVDIALKALSPGINDTTTAINCIDFLYAILERVERRRMPSRFRSVGGRLCVIARAPTFSGLTGEAFDQIRQSATGNVRVLAKLVDVLEALAGGAANGERRRTLQEHLRLVLEQAERTVPSAHDRAWIRDRASAVAVPPPPQPW